MLVFSMMVLLGLGVCHGVGDVDLYNVQFDAATSSTTGRICADFQSSRAEALLVKRLQCSSIPTACVDLSITCKNGGVVPGCGEGEKGCFAGTEGGGATFALTEGCECPPGFAGTSCQFETPQGCKEQGLVFDGGMYHPERKELQCVLDFDRAENKVFIPILNLADHWVDFQFNNNDQFLATIFSRKMDLNRPFPRNPKMKTCSKVNPMINCEATTFAQKTEQGYEFVMKAPRCEGALGPVVLNQGVDVDMVTLALATNSSTGSSVGTFTIDTSLGTFELFLRCSTGTCLAAALEDPPMKAVEVPPHVYNAYSLILPLGLVVAGVVFLSFAGVAYTRSHVGGSASLHDSKTLDVADRYRLGRPDLDRGRSAHLGEERRSSLQLLSPTGRPQQELMTFDKGLMWKDVSFTLPNGRVVLDKVGGSVAPGEMVAIIGPSGAGKSSLLDILADRPRPGSGGQVWLTAGGQADAGLQRKDEMCYVTQHDDLMESQTVTETLMFSAILRSRRGQTRAQLQTKVRTVLQRLAIDHIAHSRIGNATTGGISGGEKKRVAIGVELVTDPAVLLLDEPSSGLDSHSVDLLMDVLTQITGTGACCLFTIHQMTTNFLSSCTKVLLLSREGVAYFAPPLTCTDYFETVGYRCPQLANPADFMLDLVQQRDTTRVQTIAKAWARSPQHADLLGTLEAAELSAAQGASQDRTRDGARVRASCTLQCQQLVLRQMRHTARNITLFVVQLVATVGIAAFVGFVFFGVTDNLAGLQNRLGLLFFIIIFFALTSMSSLGVFIQSRKRYWRESQAGYYHPVPYFLAQYWCDVLPLRVLPPLVFSLVAYPLVGLKDRADSFLIFTLCVALVTVTSTSACMAISHLSTSVGQANFLTVIFLVFCMVFGGLFLSNETEGAATSLRWLSFFNYAFEGLCANEFNDLTILFDAKGLTNAPSVAGDYLLENFGMKVENLTRDMYALVGFWAAFTALGLVFFLAFGGPRGCLAKAS